MPTALRPDLIAGLMETGWALGLKYSEGFTRLWPSVVTVALALVGFLRVRRIRGPRQTIESVRETRDALRPDPGRLHGSGSPALGTHDAKTTTDPSGW